MSVLSLAYQFVETPYGPRGHPERAHGLTNLAAVLQAAANGAIALVTKLLERTQRPSGVVAVPLATSQGVRRNAIQADRQTDSSCGRLGMRRHLYLTEGRGYGLEPVAGAEVGAEGADARERVEELPRRRPAVVGERHVDAASAAGGERGEEVLAQVPASPHHQHPLPPVSLHFSDLPKQKVQAVGGDRGAVRVPPVSCSDPRPVADYAI